MLKRVPTVKVTFTKQDLVNCLVKTWYSDYGTLPRKDQIAIIYAQWSIETGQGTHCWNNNIGNSKAVDVPGKTIEYCALKGVWEIINGKRVELSPEDPGSWFRSFPTLEEGVRHHFDLLRNKRYKIAWQEVEMGNPAGFSKKLKQQGYYTASEADYTKAVTAYANAFKASSLFNNALASIEPERYTPYDAPEPFVEGFELVRASIEFGPRKIVVADDALLKHDLLGQLYNFVMMIIGFFIRKKK